MATQNVRQTIALAADGQIQKYVKTVATTITKARIMAVQAQSSAADGSVKIYNESDDSKTASALVFEAKWGTADNSDFSVRIPFAIDGISESTLSVAISTTVSSSSIESPISFTHLIIVASATLSPILGIINSILLMNYALSQ